MQSTPANDDQQDFLRAWLPAQTAVAAWLLAHGVARQDAEDLVQEVALAAHRAFDCYDPRRPFVAWVLGIARHKLADHHRARPVTLWPLLDDEARAQVDRAACELAGECDDRLWAMQECVRGLDDPARSIVHRFYAQGHGVHRIAEALRMSVNNVKVRLHRIRKRLRRCVELRLAAETRR